MKAILEFNLDNPDDVIAHKRCLKALDIMSVIYQFGYNTKKKLIQRFENSNEDSIEAIEVIFEEFFEILDNNNVNINELIN